MSMSSDSAHVSMAIVSNGLCVLGYTQYTSEQPYRDQPDPSSICSRKWVKFVDFISVTFEYLTQFAHVIPRPGMADRLE